MSIITVLYVLLMIGALAWLAWKVKLYLEREKDRESQLDEQMLYDDSFKSYLEDLKKQKRTGGSSNINSDSD